MALFDLFKPKQPEPASGRVATRTGAKPASTGSKPAPAAQKPAPAGTKPAPVPQAPPKPEEPPPAGPLTVAPDMGTRAHAGGIEVIEVGADGSQMSAAVEEAAIYYANDLPDQAIATLKQYLRMNPTCREIQPWLMLFDLYQIKGARERFDELAMEFVVKFERSAPVWEGSATATASAPKTSAASSGYFALPVHLGGDGNFAERMLEAAKGGGLRLDAAKLQSADEAGAEFLVGALTRLRKSSRPVALTSEERLIETFRQALSHSPAIPYWNVLFEVYELLGWQTEFEDLAVEYAVTLEVSPPSWEPKTTASPPAAAANPAFDAEPAEQGDVFRLEGVITGGSEAQMKALIAYAIDRTEVAVDMSAVPRVDFVSVGLVLNTMIELNKAGKTVALGGVNEMIQTLFLTMGINQFATLSRKKPL